MTTRLVPRPARTHPPLGAPPAEQLAAPPQQQERSLAGFPIQTLLPVLASISSITMIIVLRANPVMMVVGAMILVVALVGGVGMAMSQRGQRTRQRARERARYLDYLEQTRERLRLAHGDVRREAFVVAPAVQELGLIAVDDERRWERRPGDADFARPRVGVGTVPWFELSLPANQDPLAPYDDILEAEARLVASTYGSVPGIPVALPLATHPYATIVGEPEDARAVARGVVAQLAAFHAPHDLQLALLLSGSAMAEWGDVALLPHLEDEGWDGPLRARRIAGSVEALHGMLGPELRRRREHVAARASTRQTPPPLVVVVDVCDAASARSWTAFEASALEELAITVVTLVGDRVDEPSDTSLRLTIPTEEGQPARLEELRAETEQLLTPDRCSTVVLSDLCRRLAPLRLAPSSRRAETRSAGSLDVLQAFGVGESHPLALPPGRAAGHEFLRIPIGVDELGTPVHLDLKESAQGGMGPHGLCIGATGSGKSEFLRTLVLGAATLHAPDDLSFVLVDYKGGAAFTPFSSIPHVAGLIDNLADDAQLIERAMASIEGELVRRQRLLKDAGGYASIHEYREARTRRDGLPPLPYLLLVIDEFSELLTAEPEFIDLLLRIGRIGRALGVHLLLASQRVDGGRLRGLDSYLSYRIGLRTFSEQESVAILGTPDAFHLPATPGLGYLKVDTTLYTRFTSYFVSGELPEPESGPVADEGSSWRPAALEAGTRFGVDPADTRDGGAPSRPVLPTRTTVLEELTTHLAAVEAERTPIWLPPLPAKLPLFRILEQRPDDSGAGALEVPVGLVDAPREQAQHAWTVDLAAAGGHVAIVGAPQSGRTTFLRTFAAALATTRTPRQVAVYGLDLTGAGLAPLERFPHVGGVATRMAAEAQTRLLEELDRMLDARERLFREHALSALAEFRAEHTAGAFPHVDAADIVLLIDGFGQTRTEFERLAAPLARLVTRGGAYGLHVVVALTRWNEVPMALQPLFGHRFELRLGEPGESSIGRKLSATIRTDQPGRALTADRRFAQIALPAVDEVRDDDLQDALLQLADRVSASWQGPAAAPIRLLPADLDPALLPDAFDEPTALPIGLRQDTMEPALVDLEQLDRHLLVLGDSGSGKTTLLRQLAAGLIDRYSSEEVVIALMEPRGLLAAECPDDYLGGHAATAVKAHELAAAIAIELGKRQNEEATPSPRIVLFLDDYDVLAAGAASPLEPLLPYLASAKELAFNVILSRPVAGAARALYERSIQAVRETGGTTLLLSGERSEGPLWPGVQAEHLPPGRAKLIRRGETARLVQIANRRRLDASAGLLATATGTG